MDKFYFINLTKIIIDTAIKTYIELITEEKILPIHKIQLLTSIKLAKIELGLLINFKKMTLNDGIRILIFQNNKNSQSQFFPDSFKEKKKKF